MTDHMDRVRARLAELTFWTDAAQRVSRIKGNLQVLPVNMMAEALQASTEPARRLYWMREINQMFDYAMQGIAPCKAGCDACCHMATFISVHEADRIAAATGRPRADPADRCTLDDIEDDRTRFNGVPCAFLVDHQCSIYTDRPHVCRVHFSVDRDNLLCQIVPGEAIKMPSFDNTNMNVLALMVDGDPSEAKMADIREFFPPR